MQGGKTVYFLEHRIDGRAALLSSTLPSACLLRSLGRFDSWQWSGSTSSTVCTSTSYQFYSPSSSSSEIFASLYFGQASACLEQRKMLEFEDHKKQKSA
jgi:hypothetical protein